MKYKSIRQTLHISALSTRPEVAAEELYQQRINSYSAFRSGIHLGSHEIFAVAFSEMTTLLDEIRNSETRVAQLWNSLPRAAKRAFLFELIGQDMQGTTAIEGVHTTRKEIAQALEAAQAALQDSSSSTPQRPQHVAGLSSQDVSGMAAQHPFQRPSQRRSASPSRLAEFARLYLTLTHNGNDTGVAATDGTPALALPTTLSELRHIYDSVVDGEIDPHDLPDGELFRKGSVSIWDQTRGKRVHEGAANETQIQVKLTQWLALSRNHDIPLPIRAVLCHFAFETIHPFYDGNGRTGRFLLAQQLSTSFSLPTTLSLSATIAASKSQYYRAFDEAEFPLNCADASLFCFTMLTFLHQAQLSVTESLESKLQDYQAAQSHLLTHFPARENQVLTLLVQEHIFSTVPRFFTRRQLLAELHMGTAQLLRVLSDLEAQHMITRVGQKPIRYGLSSAAVQLLGL